MEKIWVYCVLKKILWGKKRQQILLLCIDASNKFLEKLAVILFSALGPTPPTAGQVQHVVSSPHWDEGPMLYRVLSPSTVLQVNWLETKHSLKMLHYVFFPVRTSKWIVKATPLFYFRRGSVTDMSDWALWQENADLITATSRKGSGLGGPWSLGL